MNPIVYIIVSFILYLMAPQDYSIVFCAVCAAVFTFQSFRVIKSTSKAIHMGIMEFNLLFLLSAFAVVYVFPLFIYGSASDYSFLHLSLFSDSSVNKVTALCTFAYSIYLSSYEYYFSKGLQRSSVSVVSIRVSDKSLFLARVFSVLAVIAFTENIIFFTRTIDASHNELTVNTYIAELTKCILIVCLVCCCEKYKCVIKNKTKAFFHYCFVPVSGFLIVMLEYFYIGDRGFIIVGGLTLLFAYDYYVTRLKAVVVLPGIVAAIVFMSLIGQIRKTDNSIREGGMSSFASASSDIISSQSNRLEYISDLTLVSNVAYLEWDYSKAYPLLKPARLLVLLSMPIPYAPTLMSNVLYGNSSKTVSTAYAITQFYNSKVTNYGDGGLGTQAVLDLYMSWSIVGVILGMWLLGMYIGKSCAYKDYNIYYLVLLITHFGLAVYLPRSTVYMCFRTVVWEIILLNLFTTVEKQRVHLK